MPQQTTKDFSARLRLALDGHPQAPSTVFGRQAWLREKLAREAGFKVSPNAIHKWSNGTARPREDNIRAIAKVLDVNEFWLSAGVTPGKATESSELDPSVTAAKSGELILAGLIEAKGGRVLFSSDDDLTSFRCSFGGREHGVLVLNLEPHAEGYTAVVPEPTGDSRLAAVFTHFETSEGTVCVDVFDLTEAPRQNFGGYSILQLERRPGRRFKLKGVRNLLSGLEAIEDLVP